MKKTGPENVLDVLEDLGVGVVSTGREIAAHCPFHEDAHPSFSINESSGLWICYQCGQAGSLEQLVAKVTGGLQSESYLREVKHRGVTRRLRERQSAPLEPAEPELPAAHLVALYEGFRAPPAWACAERRFSEQEARRFGVRWERGWVLPLWAPERTGEFCDLLGWQFKRMKYVSNFPPGMSKSETLFGIHECQGGEVTLVESPLDVVRLAFVGVQAVASFGAMVSAIQRQLILDRADRVVLSLDGDMEGRRQSKELGRWFARLLPTQVVRYPTGAKDPGELEDHQIKEIWG